VKSCLYIIVAFFWGQSLLDAQIGALSGTKLASVSYNAILDNDLEFEPTFFTSRYTAAGTVGAVDTSIYNSSVSWRMSYGLFKNAEIGFTSDGNFESVSMAFKYAFNEGTRFGYAGMCGYSQMLGNNVVPKNNRIENAFQLGLISTIQFDDNNSVDLNVQFQQAYTSDQSLPSMIYNVDFATMALDIRYPLMFGLMYTNQSGDEDYSDLTLSPGFGIETGEDFALLLFMTQAVSVSDNASKETGFGLIVTLFID